MSMSKLRQVLDVEWPQRFSHSSRLIQLTSWRPTTVISFPLNGSENEFAFEAEKPEYKLHVLQWCRYICICATPANAGKLKQAQLIRTNPRNALRGQSRSLNMVPFDMLGMVSYRCAIVTLSLRQSGTLLVSTPVQLIRF